jgi:hypothetical protein
MLTPIKPRTTTDSIGNPEWRYTLPPGATVHRVLLLTSDGGIVEALRDSWRMDQSELVLDLPHHLWEIEYTIQTPHGELRREVRGHPSTR